MKITSDGLDDRKELHMSKYYNDENRYIGTFNILGEEINGEIIHNKKTGVLFLNLMKPLDEKTFMGKSYANMPVIFGKINSGAIVTLFNNKCINNHTNAGQTQRICFRCGYLIYGSAPCRTCLALRLHHKNSY